MSTILHMLSVPYSVLTASLLVSYVHIRQARSKGANKTRTYIIPIWLTGGGLMYNLALLWGSHMVTGQVQFSIVYDLDTTTEWGTKLAFIFSMYTIMLATIIICFIIYTTAVKLMKLIGGNYE